MADPTVSLYGTVALVTGGAKRVGRAIVLELARAGCDVAVHFRSNPSLAEELASAVTAMGRRAVCIPGELTDPSRWPGIVERTVHSLGRLDVLVNNASAFQTAIPDTIERFEVDSWDAMLRTNLTAPAGLCHSAREHLAKNGRGNIVNLCDISAERPSPNHLAYCVSKAGLVAMTKALAKGLAPDIRVNAVSPGIAVFPDSYSPELRQRLTAQVPLQRKGTPEGIARVVRFLVESGDYITGQILAVDGGRIVV